MFLCTAAAAHLQSVTRNISLECAGEIKIKGLDVTSMLWPLITHQCGVQHKAPCALLCDSSGLACGSPPFTCWLKHLLRIRGSGSWTLEPTSHVFQEHANFAIFLMFSVVLVGAEPSGLGGHSEAVALQGTRLLGGGLASSASFTSAISSP